MARDCPTPLEAFEKVGEKFKSLTVDILPVWHDTKLVADLYARSYPDGRA